MRKQTMYLVFVIGILGIWAIWELITPGSTADGAQLGTIPISTTATADEVYVPAGPYARGCSPDLTTLTCDADARPINYIYVDAFYIDRTEVSNAAYTACATAGACSPPLATKSNTRPDYYTNPAYANYPVVQVDWDRANAYCRWRGQRLPTEAEWEKAARGTDLRWFPWGNTIPDCDTVNIAKRNNESCLGDTTPVDSYPDAASPYGAINMVGNVREWVNDLYESPYYEDTPYYNPQGPNYTDKGEHLVRGGSWADHIDGGSNNWVRIDEAGIYHMEAIGFRCARSAPGPGPVHTPTPTPTPTPIPSDARRIGPEGGLLWISYPGHLTALQVPAGSLATEITFTVTYTRPRSVGVYHALDHFFTLEDTPFTEPAALLLGYDSMSSIRAGTESVYRLESNTWVTSHITVEERSPRHMLAWITQPGTYGILGETHRVYLPVAIKR